MSPALLHYTSEHLCFWFLANSMAYYSLNRHFLRVGYRQHCEGKNETRNKTLKAFQCDHVAHGDVLLSKEQDKGKSRTIKKELSFLFLTIRRKYEKRVKGLWKRQREKGGEIAPAGTVCWEQVVYLGQHIASSAFLSTCLSKWRRGEPARRAALLRVFASELKCLLYLLSQIQPRTYT